MRTIDDIIDDIVSCADIADGGKADARAYAQELCEVVRALASAPGWMPIDSAPKNGNKIDLWAKVWLADSDSFQWHRYPDCWWTKGDGMTGRRERWMNLPDGVYATHWMPFPEPTR